MEPLHHRLQAAGRTLTGLSVWSVVAERPPCSQGFPSGPLWLRRVLRPGVSRWLGFDGPHVARRTEALPVSPPSRRSAAPGRSSRPDTAVPIIFLLDDGEHQTSTVVVALCGLCRPAGAVPGYAPGLENQCTPFFQFLGRTFSSRPLSRTTREMSLPCIVFLREFSRLSASAGQRTDRTEAAGS